MLAVLPVLVAAVVNTGHQYLLALRTVAGGDIDDWRTDFARYLNVDSVDPGVYDIVVAGLVHVLPVFLIALISAGFWERIFAANRKMPFDSGVVYTALLFTLLMPPNVGLFHIVIAMSFAIIFAHGIFGGEGRSFLNPALVAAAVVQITFPSALKDHPLWTELNGYAGNRYFSVYPEQDGFLDISWWDAFVGNTQGLMGATSVLAVLLGATVLVYGGIASWRLLSGQVIGLVLVAVLCNWLGGGILDMSWYWHLLLGSFAFATVFIASDPSSSCSTNSGRWVQGLMAGALVVLLRVVNPSHPDSVIVVLLLMSMTAPLIDHIVIWFNIRRRAMGHG